MICLVARQKKHPLAFLVTHFESRLILGQPVKEFCKVSTFFQFFLKVIHYLCEQSASLLCHFLKIKKNHKQNIYKLFTSQDKLVSPYHGSSAEPVKWLNQGPQCIVKSNFSLLKYFFITVKFPFIEKKT